MKTIRVLCIAMLLCLPAFAWNCTTPGQVRVQVPTGTVGNGTGDGSGQVVVDSGLTFICEALPTATTQPPSVTNTNSNTNTATGGSGGSIGVVKATGVGGNGGAGGSSTSTATGGTSTNNNTVTGGTSSANNNGNGNGSGNTTVAKGGNQQQGQQQGQQQSASAANNGNGSNNTTSNTQVDASKIPVSSAITPPLLPSAPCIKSFGGGVQTMVVGGSFGAGKIDEGCDIRETARAFSGISKLAQCKLLINEKQAKKAGVTLEDCLGPVVVAVEQPSIPDVHDMQSFPEPQVIVVPVTIPAPVVTVQPVLPVLHTEITVRPPVKKVRHHMTPVCQNGLELRCVTKRGGKIGNLKAEEY